MKTENRRSPHHPHRGCSTVQRSSHRIRSVDQVYGRRTCHVANQRWRAHLVVGIHHASVQDLQGICKDEVDAETGFVGVELICNACLHVISHRRMRSTENDVLIPIEYILGCGRPMSKSSSGTIKVIFHENLNLEQEVATMLWPGLSEPLSISCRL